MFCMLGGAGKSIQLGLEVPMRPKREAGRRPHCLCSAGTWCSGGREQGLCEVGSTTERWPGGGEEHIARRAGATQEETQLAGKMVRAQRACPGRWRQGQSKLAIPRLASTWVDPGLVCSLSGKEILDSSFKSVFELGSEASLAKGGNAEEALIAQAHRLL